MTADLASELEKLETMDAATLKLRWQEAFASPPPTDCRPALLRRALAWHVQARVSGRVNVDRLMQLAPASRSLMPGTRLVREWQGKTHQVIVQAGSFEFEGRAYRSLSAIARAITGTAWSGPLFFGLR